MRTYTYFLLNQDGSVPAFDFAQFDDDAHAREHALRVLARAPEREAVEVWNEAGPIWRHARSGAAGCEA